MSLAPSPFADVHVPVRIFIHPFSVIRWRFFIVFRWINWVILFIREIFTAVTAHPPISEPVFTASTTVTWGTAFTTPTEMTLANHAHTRPHLDKAGLSSNLFFFPNCEFWREVMFYDGSCRGVRGALNLFKCTVIIIRLTLMRRFQRGQSACLMHECLKNKIAQ